MWKHHASWIETLDGLPGFNIQEKARARVIILSKPREDRKLYFQGTYAEVAATIKALLSETPIGNLAASPGPVALRLTCCGDATPDDSSGSLRSSSTNVSSSSPPSSCASRRPSVSDLLVETASLVRHMSALPAAFRAAHFRASQPGDIFYRTVKELLPASATTANGTPGPGFEQGIVEFAIVVVGISPPSSASSSGSSGSSGSISGSGSSCKTSSPGPGAVVAVRIRSLEVRRRRPVRSDWPLVEYEAEVVPDPADTLEFVLERLDAGAVQAAEVLWWRKSPGALAPSFFPHGRTRSNGVAASGSVSSPSELQCSRTAMDRAVQGSPLELPFRSCSFPPIVLRPIRHTDPREMWKIRC